MAALAVVVGGVGVAALVRGASPEPGQPAPPTHSGSDSKPPLEAPAAPAPVDVGAVKRALAEGELQRAWELLMAAPEDAAAIALGLEAIERAAASDPRPEVDAEGADVWAALVELAVRGQELERSALEKVSLSSTESVDWGPQGQRVREAIEAALLVKARPGTVDALLLATADRYLRVHRAVNLFAELEDPAPAVDAERFPQAHVAFAYLSRFLSLDEPGLTPERHRAQEQACLELEQRLDAGVLDWPPLLAGSVLGATPNLAPLRKDWVEAWLVRLRPVPPKNQLAALALELAMQCLAEGDGLTAPDVGLPTRLVAVADDYNQGLFLPRRQLLQAALLPLTLGDLEAAKARIDQVPTDTRLANLRKATHVFATYEVLCARALPLEARGPLLEKARGYLEGDPSRERWALLRHIELLGSPSAAAPDVAAWKRCAPVAPAIVTPAWYTHYDPRSMRFPCEPARPGDTRAVLWLPPVGR